MGCLPYEYAAFFSLLLLPRAFRYGQFSEPNKERIGSKRGTTVQELMVFIAVLVGSHWRAAFRHATASPTPSLYVPHLLAVRLLATLLVGASGWHLGCSYDRVARPHMLVTSGPYSIIRHPIYTAYLLFFSGGLLALRSPGECAAMLVAALFFYTPRMDAEEALLEDFFREEFEQYRENVPWRLVPFLF